MIEHCYGAVLNTGHRITLHIPINYNFKCCFHKRETRVQSTLVYFGIKQNIAFMRLGRVVVVD